MIFKLCSPSESVHALKKIFVTHKCFINQIKITRKLLLLLVNYKALCFLFTLKDLLQESTTLNNFDFKERFLLGGKNTNKQTNKHPQQTPQNKRIKH